MAENFLLIVPAEMIEVDIEELEANSGVNRAFFSKYESGTDLWELTEAFIAMGKITAPTEVVEARAIPEFDRYWVRCS
jgi:hypothetical protein